MTVEFEECIKDSPRFRCAWRRGRRPRCAPRARRPAPADAPPRPRQGPEQKAPPAPPPRAHRFVSAPPPWHLLGADPRPAGCGARARRRVGRVPPGTRLRGPGSPRPDVPPGLPAPVRAGRLSRPPRCSLTRVRAVRVCRAAGSRGARARRRAGATIDEVETDVVEIEAKLDKLVKLCSGMIEAGKAYVATNRLFVSGVRDLSQQCRGDAVVSECLQRFGDSLQEMVSYHMILFDQAQRSVRQQLHNFIKEDVRKFKDTKKQFDKVREDMELSLVRNAQAPRHRPHEVEEATGALTLTRKCFRHLALDYVLQINVLQAKKKFEILDSVSAGGGGGGAGRMLSFMHAQYSFFQQGYSLLHQLDPYMKKLAAELDQLVIDSAVEKREMERKHAAIQQRDFSHDGPKAEFDVDAPSGVVMEGYLFKRASNAFKTWNRFGPPGGCRAGWVEVAPGRPVDPRPPHTRRWFSIQNSQLVYQKRLKVAGVSGARVTEGGGGPGAGATVVPLQDALTVVVDDLRLCSVKPCEDTERRFCFEVVSPTKSCMLQADSETLRRAWVQAVQASIASAYRASPDSCYGERLDRTASPSTSSLDSASDSRERSVRAESALQRVQSVAGNGQCGDCGQPDPRWASINLGVLLCIECSGIHRSLGVHCSKVRSLTLDSWEPELLKLMCELGNSAVNRIYEAQCEGPGCRKPTASSPRQDKEAWIKDKYVEKKFLCRPPSAPAREVPQRWRAPKCRRHHSSPRAPSARRPARLEPVLPAVAALCSGAVERRFRRDSLFCPDELDSLFSYFDAGAAAAGPRSLSSDSGLGGSSDGSSDVLAASGSVVDSVAEEEGAESEGSSGEADGDAAAEEAWAPADVRELHPGLLAHRAARARDLPALAAALAHGAEVNWANAEDEGKTPLVQAVLGGSLIVCEFLLQNGADVNQRDSRGRAPLHHATLLGRTGQVCLFLKRGADQHALDQEQQDPLSIAVREANADIVTLLRLARMAEEMREAEAPPGQPGALAGSSPTELQYRRCIQDFIGLHLEDS
ncbi:Arf-GAP with coiled-coil, ANK repeat and PH domain-containing protein 3 [Galemys pyrenaicus]|uniref:Arf-GAP with coiled-coil, ANK repeat and PH domain-containing protein n=1 Tax=Galemys pyrenaicus TaxID=202257 RepID=A0A8J5ZR08_GALPY|nr:Arf-GAP with coiled-coil, ANK repeat and PH domain-containing protein 3 [Galemys pyrenaicus]